jgi:hypothetical protein
MASQARARQQLPSVIGEGAEAEGLRVEGFAPMSREALKKHGSRNRDLIGNWGLTWGLRPVSCANLQVLRCHPCACKLFRINFPLNS